MKVVSTHYLRRRAEKRCKDIRRWQREAQLPGGVADRARLESYGLSLTARVDFRKRGKYDARYDVIAVP